MSTAQDDGVTPRGQAQAAKKRLRIAVRGGWIIAAMMLALPSRVVAGQQGESTCASQTATIVGTEGDETLEGTAGNDVIVGLGGNDVIRGRGGSDIICGGAGDDIVRSGRAGGDIYGDDGNDILFSRNAAGLTGGDGNDTLDASRDGSADLVPGDGDDLVKGSPTGFDEVQYGFDATQPLHVDLKTGLATGSGTDSLVDIDAVIGGAFDDVLIGNGGSNILVGREGDDLLTGRGGHDVFSGQQGDDRYEGGAGFDFAEYYDQNFADGLVWGPMTVNLRTGIATGDGTDTLISIEGSSGSPYTDTLIGDKEANTFFELYAGDDVVRAGPGRDTVAPGAGANDVSGGAGTDLLFYLGGKDPDHSHRAIVVDLTAGASSTGDRLRGFENIVGSVFDDTLIGSGEGNVFYGYLGDDVLVGGGGNDNLIGQAGSDTARGGHGVDVCRAETRSACERPTSVR